MFCCNFKLKNEEQLLALHRATSQPARDGTNLWAALLRVGECGLFWIWVIRFCTLAVSAFFSQRFEQWAKNWIRFGSRVIVASFMDRWVFIG